MMAFNASGWSTVTLEPEYKCCKKLKATCNLRMDIWCVQEAHTTVLWTCMYEMYSKGHHATGISLFCSMPRL